MNSYIFVNGFEIYKFKAKYGLYGYVYDFSVDYDSIGVDDILNIHKYLMKKYDIKSCLDFLKNVY